MNTNESDLAAQKAAMTQPVDLRDHDVIDVGGEKVGTVVDVLFDARTEAPEWAVVKVGALRGAHAIPIQGSHRDADGSIVIPYSRERVKQTPKLPRDHILTPDIERELVECYRG